MSSMLQDMIHTVSVHVERVTGVVDKMESRINGMADRVEDLVDDMKVLKTDNRDQRERITKVEAIQARPGDISITNDNDNANVGKVNQSGSGSSVIDQSAGKTHE